MFETKPPTGWRGGLYRCTGQGCGNGAHTALCITTNATPTPTAAEREASQAVIAAWKAMVVPSFVRSLEADPGWLAVETALAVQIAQALAAARASGAGGDRGRPCRHAGGLRRGRRPVGRGVHGGPRAAHAVARAALGATPAPTAGPGAGLEAVLAEAPR